MLAGFGFLYSSLHASRSIVLILLVVGICNDIMSGSGANASQKSDAMFEAATASCIFSPCSQVISSVCLHAGSGHWRATRSRQIGPQMKAIVREHVEVIDSRSPLLRSMRH